MGSVFKVLLVSLIGSSMGQTLFNIPDPRNLNRIADKNNQFAMEMIHMLGKGNSENIIFSPISIGSIMAMLQAGAEGETKKEIGLGMGFPDNDTELFLGHYELNKLIQAKTGNGTLEAANRIFASDDIKLKENFVNTLKHYFKSRAMNLDFTRPKKAAEEINSWVYARTKKIQNLIDPGVLNNQTKLVLVNALYFKAGWLNKFYARATKQKPFYTNDGKTSNLVDMMNTEEYFQVADIDFLNSKAIVLPYEGKMVEMIILLPNERTGLKRLEDSLRRYKFSQITEKLSNSLKAKNIILNMPKFAMDSTIDLIEPMKKLQISRVFDENLADLSGISDSTDHIYVSKLIQKAFLAVEENGSEGGAASYAAVFTPLSIGPIVEEEITVDHPFLGFIRERDTNTILFVFRKTQ